VDYGLSKYLRDDNQTYTLCGTPQFLAPEVITCQGHNKSVDFWAVREGIQRKSRLIVAF
jgi:serine/threonine protein kinase